MCSCVTWAQSELILGLIWDDFPTALVIQSRKVGWL